MFSLFSYVVTKNETFTWLPKSKVRIHKWVEKKANDSKVDEWLFRGMKLHEVEVTPRGRIDGACEGENAWDGILRFMAFREFNVFIVHVKDQNPTNMATHWAWIWDTFWI